MTIFATADCHLTACRRTHLRISCSSRQHAIDRLPTADPAVSTKSALETLRLHLYDPLRRCCRYPLLQEFTFYADTKEI